jgi:hypothetical protein
MDLQRQTEIYSGDRMRRMVVFRRTDGHFQIMQERLRRYENRDEYRPIIEPFPEDGSLPEWSMVVDREVHGLFGTLADAVTEARRLVEDYSTRYAGMTINERLFNSGLVADFDAAARTRSRERMIRILSVLDVEDATQSADAILRNPEWYGY